jgi:Concanavalin A-like lectin/glucanases superfamily
MSFTSSKGGQAVLSMPSTPSPAFAWTLNGNVKETISGKAPLDTYPVTPTYAAAQYGQRGLYQTSMRFTNTGGELPLLPLSGGVTIALWLYYTNSPSAKVFSISSFSATTNNNDTGKISFDIVGSTTTCFNFSGGTTQAFQRTIPNSWNHYVITFITGGKIIFYLNGVQQADNVNVPSSWGGSDTNSYRFGGNVGLGCTEGAAAAVTGMTFSDWRFYNTVLTPVQIQTIYQSGGYYLASQMSMTGAPLLKLLSAQAQSSAAGLFSLRAVSGVTARSVQVVRSSDSAVQDFYADRVGNLLTAPVTGQSLSRWLGGATGYVATWYDQSGNGNHVSQSTQAVRPTIGTGVITFTGTQWFSNAATTGGCLSACIGKLTKYTYTATWKINTSPGVMRVLEHNSQSYQTSHASALLVLNSTNYGFNGESNDINGLASYTVGTQISTIMRIDNSKSTNNITIRSNGTNATGTTNDPLNLYLDNYQFNIGRKRDNSEFFNGIIKNVFVFSTSISDADTAIIDAWQQSI